MSTNEFAAFAALDLAPIKMKLMHVESGEGWSALRADAVETEYRRFLFLMKKYPDAEASPTVDVDIFWHYHILDTMKYARDCETLFGYFLHHYPYVGIGAGANEGDHAAGGERMRAIYEAEFGIVAAANEAYAYCGSPNTPREAANDAYAYCGSPNTPREAAKATYAYCGAPNTPRQAVDAAYAYCGAPNTPREAAKATYAYCGAPNTPHKTADAAYAYCGAPNTPREAAMATYAYCGAPNTPREAAKATYAYCGAPNTPRQAANTAYAYCGAPGKQAQSEGADQGKELAHAA